MKTTYTPFDFDNRQISVQPELMIAFLKDRKKSLVSGRVYLALKFLDKQGSGILPVEYVKSAFCANKNGYLHIMTWNSLKAILERFNGRFWLYANDKIVLYNPAKVANELGLQKFGCNSIYVRHEDLFSGNQAFGAACYGAYITTLGDMPTSRTTIAKALDLSKSAQIRYEKQLNIQQVAATIIVDKNNTYDPKSKEYKQYRSEHGQALNPVTTGNGKVIYGKRIGNIRSIERMKKKTGGRRRRKLNEKIDRVEKGQRNQSSEKNARNDHNLTIRYIKNKLGTIYHTEAVEYLKGTVKKALSFKYIRNGRFGMKRVGTYDTMPCLLFFQE